MSWLIVGLGNPGDKYERTRHNAGFRVVDQLANHFGWSWSKKLFTGAIVAEGNRQGNKIILAKPQTFMNRSGKAVAALQKRFKIPNEQTIIVYDDIDIPLGDIRFREQGSAGSHNGMKSVITQVHSEQIPRLRVGIGPAPEHIPLDRWVLGTFSKDEEEALAIRDACQYIQEKVA